MPLVNVKLDEGVFSPEQKQQMLQQMTASLEQQMQAFEGAWTKVGKLYKITATTSEGISTENAKKVAKLIRDEGPKGVKTQIQGDELLTRSSSPWIWVLTPFGPRSRISLVTFLAFSALMPCFVVATIL